MQTKLNDILSTAKGWMTSAAIAKEGGWRNPAHVGIELGKMEKADQRVERRKSPTEKMGNGMPATEWKLTEKTFSEETESTSSYKKRMAELRTTKPTPQVAAAPKPDPATQEENEGWLEATRLRDQLRLAEQQRDEHFRQMEQYKAQLTLCESANEKWMALAREFKCDSLKDLRAYIGNQNYTILTKNNDVTKLRNELAERPVVTPVAEAPRLTGATQFVVRTPSKPARFVNKEKNAYEAAMSAAKRFGIAEVFALVPAGKAVRGAEWRAK